MTAEQFAYWLQGFAELNDTGPTPEQWKGIKDKLQTVPMKGSPEVRISQDTPDGAAQIKAQEDLMLRALHLSLTSPRYA